MLLAWQGRREEARGLLQSALTPNVVHAATTTLNSRRSFAWISARVLLWRGEYVEGEQHLTRVARIWKASGQPTNTVSIQLGRLYTEQGRSISPRRNSTASMRTPRRCSVPVPGTIRMRSIESARCISRKVGPADARRYFERSDRETKDVEGLSPNRAYARLGLLRLALAENDSRALATARELLTQIESAKTRQDMPDEEAAANMLLGAALSRAGKLQEAKPHLDKAVAMRVRMDAPDSPALAEARLYLAQQRQGEGARDEASALVAEAARALGAHQAGPQFQRLLSDTRRGTRPSA